MVTQQHKKPSGSTSRPSTSNSAGANSRPSSSSTATPKPSISKLKSSLRQTKRLLLKPRLDAAVKRDAERRQKALEQELETALGGEKERQMAQKYHMVKFFERQKVLRKLLRAKRTLLAGESKGKARKSLEQELEEHRVDLNYILHYPKGRKYVSLLKPADAGGVEERREVREWVRGRMAAGALPAEPEVDKLPAKSAAAGGPVAPLAPGAKFGGEKKVAPGKATAGKAGKPLREPTTEEEQDAFFAPAGSGSGGEDSEEREAEMEEEREERHELEDVRDAQDEDDESEGGTEEDGEDSGAMDEDEDEDGDEDEEDEEADDDE